MRVSHVAVLAAAVLGGCTSVKMVQRDGCWVRQTKQTFGGTKEDLGPCARAQPRWVDDRLTRLVQECIAQSDYRWQARAVEAWSRRQPMPAQESQEKVIETCMNDAAAGVVTQNESLQARLSEVTSDRTTLQADAAQARDHDRQTADRLAEFLGEAAKRPPPVATATATATSDGTATTDSGLTAETGAESQALPTGVHSMPVSTAAATPEVPVVPAASPGADAPAPPPPASATPPATPSAKDPPASASKRAKRARAVRRPTALRSARGGGCDLPVTASVVAPAQAAQPTAAPPTASSADGRSGDPAR